MTLRDFTAGEVLTANNLEQYVMRQNGLPVGFFTKSAVQSINSATITAVTWDQESFDTDAAHSTVSNTSRFTAATAGKYRVYAQVEWASNVTGVRDIFFRVNAVATDYLRAHTAGLPAANVTQSASGIIPVTLIVGDYIECYVNQTSGGALNISVTAAQHFWAVEYVSE